MDMKDWMYKLPGVGKDLSFLHHVRNFVTAAKKHCRSLGQGHTSCSCNSNKNKLLQDDNVVQPHLIRHGLVKDYFVWEYHIEVYPSIIGASGGNQSATSTVHEEGQKPSSSTTTMGGDSANHDYISIEDLLQDMGGNNSGGDGEQGDVLGPKMRRCLKILLTVWTKMTFCLEIQSG